MGRKNKRLQVNYKKTTVGAKSSKHRTHISDKNKQQNHSKLNQKKYQVPRRKRFVNTAGNIIVNYTPDLTDEAYKDVSTHATQTVIGNSFMATRMVKRATVSLGHVINKSRISHHRKYGNYKKAEKIGSKIQKHKGLNVRTSIRATVSNQTRKLSYKLTSQNDLSSQTVGKLLRGTWASVKYRKQFLNATKFIASTIKSVIIGMITFVTSIPSMLITFITSVPIIIIVIIVSIIITCFSSYSYYGRIDGLMKHISQLNTKYQVNIDVIDLLSITYALDWTEGSYEMYDTVCSYIYEKKGENVDFETALTRVFVDNNPARNIDNNYEYGFNDNQYPQGTYSYKTQKKHNEKYYFQIYPDYKALSLGKDRKSYGNDANIKTLKEKARNSQEYNLTIYDEYEWKNNGMVNYENMEVNSKVLSYSATIKKYAQKYEMNDFISLIQAVMMQESSGNGLDPMQSSEGAYNKKYPKIPNGITDPDYSIECGIQELKSCLKDAGVKDTTNMQGIYLALQGYNFGNGYIKWALKNDGGYTKENAIKFSKDMMKKYGYSSYGDVNYVDHVMRYYGADLSNVTEISKKILAIAKSKLNCPYYWGKSGPDQFDCSGFIYYCLKNAGVSVGRLTADGYAHKFKEIPSSQLEPGDLITFTHDGGKTAGHIGIYIGNETFIHASGEGATCLGNHASRGHVVKYSKLGGYYRRRIFKCRRVS